MRAKAAARCIALGTSRRWTNQIKSGHPGQGAGIEGVAVTGGRAVRPVMGNDAAVDNIRPKTYST